MPLFDQWKKIGDLQLDGRLVSAIRSLCTLPWCKVESLETRIVNIHVFIYCLWCLHGSTRGWLVFNCVFRFGRRKYTQILSGLKKVDLSLLYPYDIRHCMWVKNQVRTRKLTDTRSPIVSIRYVGDYEVSLNDLGTRLLKSLCSSSFSSFLHGLTMLTDPIFCFAASNSNTPGRHCRKNERKKKFFWNVQTHLHVLCTCVYSTHCRQIRGGSMYNQGKVCLNWRHKRGRPRSHPLNNFI